MDAYTMKNDIDKEKEKKERSGNNRSDLSEFEFGIDIGTDFADAVGTKGKEFVLDVAEGVSSVARSIADNAGDLLEGAGDVAVGVGKVVGGALEGIGDVLGDLDV